VKFKALLNIVFIVIVFFFSCSKDKDEISPTLIINAPYNLQQVNGVDTLKVLATISDDRNIEYVSVSLRNDNDIPVLSTITKTPNTKDYDLNILYFFDNIFLPSGQYDLRVSAFDGENTTTRYVQLYLNETPKSRTGIFVVSNTGASSDVYLLDNMYTGIWYSTILGDYLGSEVNSHDQQLLHASSGTIPPAKINSINLNSGLDLWDIPILSPSGTPYYNSFFYDNRTIYLGKSQGGVAGYGENGVGVYIADVINGFEIEEMLVHDNILVTEQQAIMGGVIRLIPYWMASGVVVGTNATFPPNEDVLGMFTKSANDIVVISNNAALNGNLTYYEPTNGSLTSYPIGLGQIDDCLEIDIGIYLVVHGGDISMINTNSGFPFLTPTAYLSGVGANRIWYDDLTNELFVASGSVLNIYDYSSSTLKGSYTQVNPIKEVLFWYNK